MVEDGLLSSLPGEAHHVTRLLEDVKVVHDDLEAIILAIIEETRSQDQSLSDEWLQKWQIEEDVYTKWICTWQHFLDKILEEDDKAVDSTSHSVTSTMSPVHQSDQARHKDKDPQTLHPEEATVNDPIVQDDANVDPAFEETIKNIPDPSPTRGQLLLPAGGHLLESLLDGDPAFELPHVGGQPLLHVGDQASAYVKAAMISPTIEEAAKFAPELFHAEPKPHQDGGLLPEPSYIRGLPPNPAHDHGMLSEPPRVAGLLFNPPHVRGGLSESLPVG